MFYVDVECRVYENVTLYTLLSTRIIYYFVVYRLLSSFNLFSFLNECCAILKEKNNAFVKQTIKQSHSQLMFISSQFYAIQKFQRWQNYDPCHIQISKRRTSMKNSQFSLHKFLILLHKFDCSSPMNDFFSQSIPLFSILRR